MIPSIELAADGPVIRSFLFFSETYICEVRLEDDEHDCDLALKDTVANYRISLGRHEVIRNAVAIEQAKAKQETPPQPEKIKFQKATIGLRHTQFGLGTKITYVREHRDEWLQSVLSALPIDVLKRSPRS